MIGKSPNQNQGNFFQSLLIDLINPNHELVNLAKTIKWQMIENEFAKLYSNTGTPAKPIRLMAGLLILKQMYNLGDETIIDSWIQNPYMQYFCGEAHFQWKQPCDPSDLVHFRKRIGEEGVKEILKLSLQLFEKEVNEAKVVHVDTTVQEKNITFPTDVKLQIKIIRQCNKIAQDNDLVLRQSYKQVLKKLLLRIRFSNHPLRQKAAAKARRKIKTIAGRLVRDLERKMDKKTQAAYSEKFSIYKKVLSQTRFDKNKIYSLHEPDVSCIAKGKAHKPYEFGSKVGIVRIPGANIIVGVESFQGNPHDSNTLIPCLISAYQLTGKIFDKAGVDRGCRGKKQIGDTEIVFPGTKEDKKLSEYALKKKKEICRQRSGIEPIIGHIKHDCRMLRNYLKGVEGDKINAILAVAAFNFRQWINQNRAKALFGFIRNWLQNWKNSILPLPG